MRKHEAMYQVYGKDNIHICKECCNFRMHEMRSKRVSKCDAYGVTCSEATDWNGRKTACGLFNTPFDDNQYPLIKVLKHSSKPNEMQCEGQLSII